MATKQLKNMKLSDTVVTSVPSTIVETVTCPSGNDTITVDNTDAANPTVAVQISSDSDNGLKVSHTGNKGLYVNKESLGLSTAYVAKGSATVAELNTGDSASSPAATWEDGWVYNLSDSGDLANGIGGTSLHVDAGDNVVRITEGTGSSARQRWDKLSTTVVVPTYTGSGVVDITNYAVSLRTKTNGGLETPTNASTSNPELAVKVGPGVEIPTSGTDAGKVKANVGAGLGLPTSGSDSGKIVVVVGPGIEIPSTGTYAGKVKVLPGSGLTLPTSGSDSGKVAVYAGSGLELPSTGDDAGKVAVKPGSNIGFSSSAVVVDIDKTTTITDNTTVSDLITALGGVIAS